MSRSWIRAALLAFALFRPPEGSAQTPRSLFLEELTSPELRDLIQAGYRTAILPTGGTEDNGPHMVLGKHNAIVAYTSERIARELGSALVAPVIAYVPEGAWTPPTDHMVRPGTMSLPDFDGYRDLLVAAANSLKASGFERVLLLGDSGGNQSGLEAVANELNGKWHGTAARALYVSDYYAKSAVDQKRYVAENTQLFEEEVGSHAGVLDTSELLVARPSLVLRDRIELAADSTGASGDPARATRELGVRLLEIKVQNALAQIRATFDYPTQDGPSRAGVTPGEVFPSRSRVLLEEMTWIDVRDALAAGKKVGIVPTGGTEKNGFHMALGKHNFLIREGALEMARKLGNALVAPVIPYVPEEDATPESPGVLACRGDCFESVLTAAARSLAAGGFTDILLIGDNGGSQAGLRAVADRLSREWAGSGVRVFALTDYYEKGHAALEADLEATYGWDAETVGSHGGIADTSQLMYARPQHVRMDQLAHSRDDREGSGVTGDPTKATPAIGMRALAFKVDAGIAQYRNQTTGR